MRARTTRIVGGGVGLLAAAALGLGVGLSTTAGAATDTATDPATDTATGAPGDCDGTGPGRGMGHEHTDVTGDELTTVTDAVAAHDATLTVEQVRKDPDGSYDVLATDAEGNPAMVEVSADLATVEVRPGGPGGGRGMGPGEGRGGHGFRGGARGTDGASTDDGTAGSGSAAPASLTTNA